MADTSNILAGMGPTGLVHVAPEGTVGPTDALVAIPAEFLDAGLCDESGLAINLAETVNDVKSYGSTQVSRKLVADSSISYDVVFQEHNAVTLAVYNRLELDGLVVSDTGAIAIEHGPVRTATYAVVFDVIDGGNHIRHFCPRAQVSARKGRNVAKGKEITLGVTITPLADETGTAVYEHIVVAALAA